MLHSFVLDPMLDDSGGTPALYALCFIIGGIRFPKLISSVGRGNAGIGEIVVEIWFYLPEVYTFGEESEIQDVFSKNFEKVKFP